MVRKIISGSIILFCFLGCQSQPSVQNNSLELIASIPLPNVKGRIDHLAFDGKRKYIYVAALGNNTVEVVDLNNLKVTHTIRNLSEPQGIIFIPGSNSILVANGDNGECDIFNADSFQKIDSIKLSGDADNVRYDSTENKIYVGYGGGGIAIIDATTYKLISEVKLSGHPESFQIDLIDKKIYVNVPDQKQIEIIDIEKNSVTDKWKLTAATSNFPMSLDDANHRLFIGCRQSSKLLVMDTETGKMITTLNIDTDVDDIFFDSATRHIYLSCGGGYLDVIAQTDPNTYQSLGTVTTHSGARTSLFIPSLHQIIVASPAGYNSEASLLVYQIK